MNERYDPLSLKVAAPYDAVLHRQDPPARRASQLTYKLGDARTQRGVEKAVNQQIALTSTQLTRTVLSGHLTVY